MRAIKAQFDGRGILNPYKVFPEEPQKSQDCLGSAATRLRATR
jgi:hypothetical protein